MLMFYLLYQTSWGKEIKCEACRKCYLFFAKSLNSIIQEHNTRAQMLYSIYHMK